MTNTAIMTTASHERPEIIPITVENQLPTQIFHLKWNQFVVPLWITMRPQRNKTLRSPLSMVKVISQEADCEQPEDAESLNSMRRPWHFLPLCCLYLVGRRPRITKLKDPTTRPVWSPIFRSLN